MFNEILQPLRQIMRRAFPCFIDVLIFIVFVFCGIVQQVSRAGLFVASSANESCDTDVDNI